LPKCDEVDPIEDQRRDSFRGSETVEPVLSLRSDLLFSPDHHVRESHDDAKNAHWEIHEEHNT